MNFLKTFLFLGLISSNINAATELSTKTIFKLWKKKAQKGKQTMKVTENGKVTFGYLAWNLEDNNESWNMEYYGKEYNITNSKIYWGSWRVPAVGFSKLLTYPISEWENHLKNVSIKKNNSIITVTCQFDGKPLIIKIQNNPEFKILYLLANETEFKFN